jgi:uncharacterized protein (TIRG00374 family)
MHDGSGDDVDSEASHGRGTWRLLRRLLNIALLLASFGGLAWLVAAQHAQLGHALLGIGKAKAGLVVAAIGCERLSMLSFARQQRLLLRAGGHHLSRFSAVSITFAANALSVTIPLAGPGLATAFTYQEFERRAVGRPAAAFALVVSGVLSTLSLTMVLAAGALASGNPLAAALGLLGALPVTAGIAGLVLTWRVPASRRLLVRAAVAGVRSAQRLRGKPGEPPEEQVAKALRQLATLRLSRRDWAWAVCLAFLNWLADAACLLLSIRAAGLHVPLHDLLLVWSAGIAASSIVFTPGGAGVVEAALVAALAGVGLPTAGSAVAVMIYRLISLWLVVLAGWILFIVIKSRRARKEPDPVPVQDAGAPSLRDNG